jgi:hypothetical protein
VAKKSIRNLKRRVFSFVCWVHLKQVSFREGNNLNLCKKKSWEKFHINYCKIPRKVATFPAINQNSFKINFLSNSRASFLTFIEH